MVYTQVDLIFRGSHSSVNFSFLNNLLLTARDIRLDYSDNDSELSSADIHEILTAFRSDNYVYLVFSMDYLMINDVSIPTIFVDLTLSDSELELLFFFDVKDFVIGTYKKRVDELAKWAKDFAVDYGFDYFVCRMDNGNEEEYYFDNKGTGPFYNMLEG